jgi:hypothetical protein
MAFVPDTVSSFDTFTSIQWFVGIILSSQF